jgi:hypothetical protein
MTPEAMQAAGGVVPSSGPPPAAPPMAQGGMPPMDPAMAMGGGAPPMGPAMAQGGMPPMDPMAAQGGAPAGGLPPEILQDQEFIMALQQMGIMLDPASGTFIDHNGQPVPPEIILQAYDAFMQEMVGAQQMAPQGGAPMDPMAMGDPMAGGMPPEAAPQEGAMGGAPDMAQVADALIGTIQSAMDGIAQGIQDQFTTLAQKIEALSDEIGRLQLELGRKGDEEDLDTVQEDIAADLEPPVQKTASAPKQRKRPSSLMAIIGKTK